MQKLFSFLQTRFTIDKRSLGLFRILFGMTIMFDVLSRARDLTDHYTDLGIATVDLVQHLYPGEWAYSFYWYPGSEAGAVILLALILISSFMLTIGWNTKIATIVTWYFITCLHFRNIFITMGGDDVVRVMLFWCMFLPLGARYSLDNKFSKIVKDPLQSLYSLPVALALSQFILMYFMTGILKWSPAWVPDGTALSMALDNHMRVTDFGHYLLGFPSLLKNLTYFTYIIEVGAPLLFLLFSGWGRLFVIFLFWGFHFGIFLTMDIEMFPFICIVTWILFLPKCVWEKFKVTKSLPIPPVQVQSLKKLHLLLLIPMILVLFENYESYKYKETDSHAMGPSFRKLIKLISLSQSWGMFAPKPNALDSWYSFVGLDKKKNARNILINTGGEVAAIPPDIRKSFPTVRWRMYMERLSKPGFQDLYPALAAWACRKYELEGVMLFEMKKVNTKRKYRPSPLWKGPCKKVLKN